MSAMLIAANSGNGTLGWPYSGYALGVAYLLFMAVVIGAEFARTDRIGRGWAIGLSALGGGVLLGLLALNAWSKT